MVGLLFYLLFCCFCPDGSGLRTVNVVTRTSQALCSSKESIDGSTTIVALFTPGNLRVHDNPSLIYANNKVGESLGMSMQVQPILWPAELISSEVQQKLSHKLASTMSCLPPVTLQEEEIHLYMSQLFENGGRTEVAFCESYLHPLRPKLKRLLTHIQQSRRQYKERISLVRTVDSLLPLTPSSSSSEIFRDYERSVRSAYNRQHLLPTLQYSYLSSPTASSAAISGKFYGEDEDSALQLVRDYLMEGESAFTHKHLDRYLTSHSELSSERHQATQRLRHATVNGEVVAGLLAGHVGRGSVSKRLLYHSRSSFVSRFLDPQHHHLHPDAAPDKRTKRIWWWGALQRPLVCALRSEALRHDFHNTQLPHATYRQHALSPPPERPVEHYRSDAARFPSQVLGSAERVGKSGREVLRMERYRDGLLGHVQRDVLYVPLQNLHHGARNDTLSSQPKTLHGEYESRAPSGASGSFNNVLADVYAFHEGEVHLLPSTERDCGDGIQSKLDGDVVSGQTNMKQSAVDETRKTRAKTTDTWVVLVHGFGGSATQMQRLALSLLQPAVSGRYLTLQCAPNTHACSV